VGWLMCVLIYKFFGIIFWNKISTFFWNKISTFFWNDIFFEYYKERMIYDYIVIGGGPSGLTFSQIASSISGGKNKRILLLESTSELGGCHSVDRVNGFFTEHGPRVYSNRYKNFIFLLEKMGLDFKDLFSSYTIPTRELYYQFIKKFNILELIYLCLGSMMLIVHPYFGKNVSMEQFTNKLKFSNESKDMIDKLCRSTDGATIHNYPLHTFLNLFYQHVGFTFYQPRRANDLSLFRFWKMYLLSRKVEIKFNETVEKVENGILYTNNGQYKAKKYIFCIPPIRLYNIIPNFISKEWINDTKYLKYISITLHWDKKLDLPIKSGMSTNSEWGLAYIILSNHTTFESLESQTVISAAITVFDKKGISIKKTAKQCTEKELKFEVYIQLNKILDKKLYFPKYTLISKNNQTAFVKTSNSDYIPSRITNQIYTCGTHNGNSLYPFTTIESACENSMVLANELLPESIKIFKPRYQYTLLDIFRITFFIFVFLFIFKK
jgi:hypothetical protein